ncbi:MAG: aminotransferase class III-fold pyridoxal phosphate-dependent enzyme [Deltaproteobacteria bacterium]|nr:aminotransferase class III-fold pyridoxal phosphate-dependent enzyme [Deltaproteobacteria bacterium]
MSMSAEDIVSLCKKHTIYPWSKGNDVNPLPITRAEGVYFYTATGKKILDFNSQLMSVLIGHQHPKVIAAMKKQIDELIFVHPGTATEARARLGKLMAEVTPGNINSFFFTLGGAEANENAVKMARAFTKKQKILTRYRSYHGATNMTMQMTGDPRRWGSEPGGPGFVRVMDPNPYYYSFGATDAERTENNLRYLDEVIQYEGPQNIAAMFIETVTGTNGVLVPTTAYMQGLKKLLEKHGILLVCDEVMAGFGRTGKLYAFDHFGIVPDMVTLAKGLTSSYFPLGAVGISDPIKQFLDENVYYGGLTYNSHPVGMATAEAVINVMKEEGMIENCAKMGGVMRSEMDRLQKKHRSMKEGRNIGLFGMIDVQKNSKGDYIAPYNGTHPAMQKLQKFFVQEGLHSFVRWSSFTTNPPLCITEAQLKEGFQIIDRALDITDEAFEG